MTGVRRVLFRSFYKTLGLTEKNNTTEDMIFTLEIVSCLGACGLAPAITVNDQVYGKMTPEKVKELIEKLRGEANEIE